jgi:transposase
MPTRAAFLSAPNHRIRFVYGPKHSSWLNQIECWFSILVRRLIKRGNFTSIQDLRQQILDFIAYSNRTLASHATGNLRAFLNRIKLLTYFSLPALVLTGVTLDTLSNSALRTSYFVLS